MNRYEQRIDHMQTIELSVGTLRYQDLGSGYPLLFMHGALANGWTWRKILPAMAQTYRCIVPDLPLGGHSIALQNTADLSPSGITHMVYAFVNALRLQEVVLIGNDTGGAYAQIFAATFPERVAGMVLSNCDGLERFPPPYFTSLQKGIQLPGYTFLMAQLFRIQSFVKSRWALGLLTNSVSKEELAELYVNPFVMNGGVRADFVKVVSGWSPLHTQRAAESLARFPKPVLALWGTDDKILFPLTFGQRVSAIFPNSQFVMIDGTATYVQEDQPAQWIEQVSRFIRSYVQTMVSVGSR